MSSCRSQLGALQTKFDTLSLAYHDLQKQYDALSKESRAANTKLRQLSGEIESSRKAELSAVEVAKDLRENEKRLTAEIRCLQEKVKVSEDVQFEKKKLKSQLDAARLEMERMKVELSANDGESRVQRRREEKMALDVQELQNSMLSLRQENFILRKRVAKLVGDVQNQSQVVGGPRKDDDMRMFVGGGDGPRVFPNPHQQQQRGEEARSSPSGGLVNNRRPASAFSSPTHNLPAGSHLPCEFSARNEERDNIKEKTQHAQDVSASVMGLVGVDTMARGNVPQNDSMWMTKTFDKQIMLLEMEKNQIESELVRYPSSSHGRTAKERETKLHLEARLAEIDDAVHRLRQESRISISPTHAALGSRGVPQPRSLVQ